MKAVVFELALPVRARLEDFALHQLEELRAELPLLREDEVDPKPPRDTLPLLRDTLDERLEVLLELPERTVDVDPIERAPERVR